MRPYAALLNANVRTLLQYRSAAAAGVATQIFWGFVRVMVFEAFFRYNTAEQPMTMDEVRAYIWLGQAFILFIPWIPDREVLAFMRSGQVGYELLRPVDLYNLWFARAVAFRLAPVALRAAPLLTLALLFFGLGPPASAEAGAAFAVSMAGALLVTSAYANLINISAMWTVSGEGALLLGGAAVGLLTGISVPVPFFPDWSQPIIDVLPFRGMADTPYRFYVGLVPPGALLFHVAQQAAWGAALVLFGRWLVSLGQRRLVIQGG